MRTEIKATSAIRKLIHITAVAVAMVGTLGVAVVVSGKPNEIISTKSNFVKQTASQTVAAVPVLAAFAEPVEAKQPELLQPIANVEAKPAIAQPRKQTVTMVVTAYCPCTKCCGESAIGITASGKHVSHNEGRFVAADSSLAFGTKILIPGYSNQPVEVLDRGGAIKGNRIDVFFATHQRALEWGRQTLEVTILD